MSKFTSKLPIHVSKSHFLPIQLSWVQFISHILIQPISLSQTLQVRWRIKSQTSPTDTTQMRSQQILAAFKHSPLNPNSEVKSFVQQSQQACDIKTLLTLVTGDTLIAKEYANSLDPDKILSNSESDLDSDTGHVVYGNIKHSNVCFFKSNILKLQHGRFIFSKILDQVFPLTDYYEQFIPGQGKCYKVLVTSFMIIIIIKSDKDTVVSMFI